jgi:hypothetical protein
MALPSTPKENSSDLPYHHVWYAEPPPRSATWQKWESYLQGLKNLPDNTLGKKEMIERTEYLMSRKKYLEGLNKTSR